ncbi:flagellar basal body-associated FliL family protein [Exiguobacterium flavidum]|uniref:flagellar basal body-associated FliL family protein n=1 Tax=Exiguobacterium flavidum TaxID=2184695 RepID=UPI000DF7E035|nr:flagellar basal body-associated FliL family protein [Exiguobacterium flavidum]
MEEEKKKSKLRLPLLLIVIAAMMVGAGYAVYQYLWMETEPKAAVKQPTGEELAERSFATDDLTTNIADERFLNVQFTIVTDDAKTKTELELRKFQIHNIILGNLAEMKKKDLDSKQDMARLEEKLRVQFKELLEEGDVQRVYTTKKIIQ